MSVKDQIIKDFRQINPYPYCKIENQFLVTRAGDPTQTGDLTYYSMLDERQGRDGSDPYNFSKNKCSLFHNSLENDEVFYEANHLLIFTGQANWFYLDSIKFSADTQE